ncbi:MAG: DNA-directed RNA polymerase subunit beta [Bacillota bacterium]|nr:DNA-directed RNA polymerase subunit beta [Bacillota bacterium]
MPVNDNRSTTREQFKKAKNQDEKKPQERIKWDVRLFPIWLRLIVLFVALIGVLLTGAVVGYSVVGKGKMADALKMETWTHIHDLVVKEK